MGDAQQQVIQAIVSMVGLAERQAVALERLAHSAAILERLADSAAVLARAELLRALVENGERSDLAHRAVSQSPAHAAKYAAKAG